MIAELEDAPVKFRELVVSVFSLEQELHFRIEMHKLLSRRRQDTKLPLGLLVQSLTPNYILQLSRVAYNTFESLEYNSFKRILNRMRYGKEEYIRTLTQTRTQYIEAAGAEITEHKAISNLKETLRRAEDKVKYFSGLALSILMVSFRFYACLI